MQRKIWNVNCDTRRWRGTMIGIVSVLVACFLAVAPVSAANVRVLGLFKDRAVLRINGVQHVLRVGETSPEGVTLVAASADEATFRVGDVLQTAPLGDQIALSYESSKSIEQVTLTRDARGMYLVPGQINGRGVDMMLDTGATYVSMNRKVARKLGLQYRLNGKPIPLSTANGRVTGYKVRLRNVRVGGIEVEDVDAVVSDGNFPEVTLLGMSFLGRLDMEHKQEGTVVLRQTR